MMMASGMRKHPPHLESLACQCGALRISGPDKSAAIREHACEILDGGEEAFRKRREKYKI